MSRPKSIFSTELASKAQADLDSLDHHGVIQKLKAIVAASKHPIETVAEVLDVAAETIWRWARTYTTEGLEGLYPKPRRAKSSKLSPPQKEQVLAWIDESKTPEGREVHWTLERLRQAIIDHFDVTLGINTLGCGFARKTGSLKCLVPGIIEETAPRKRLLKNSRLC